MSIFRRSSTLIYVQYHHTILIPEPKFMRMYRTELNLPILQTRTSKILINNDELTAFVSFRRKCVFGRIRSVRCQCSHRRRISVFRAIASNFNRFATSSFNCFVFVISSATSVLFFFSQYGADRCRCYTHRQVDSVVQIERHGGGLWEWPNSEKSEIETVVFVFR